MSKFEIKVGNSKIKLNKHFIEKQDAMDNLDDLKSCYRQKLEIYNSIIVDNDPKQFKEFARLLTNLENEIQELFNFEPNVNFHRFWETPKCECPKLDNEDCHGVGIKYINPKCKFHGEEDE